MILIIKPLLLSWFITNFEPGQSFITWLYKYIPKRLKSTRSYLGCFKCVSFWLTLILTQSLLTAILFSLVAYTYDRVMNSFPINI